MKFLGSERGTEVSRQRLYAVGVCYRQPTLMQISREAEKIGENSHKRIYGTRPLQGCGISEASRAAAHRLCERDQT